MAKKTIKLCNQLIGENTPVLMIAEIGINHNGSIDITKKLMDEIDHFYLMKCKNQ